MKHELIADLKELILEVRADLKDIKLTSSEMAVRIESLAVKQDSFHETVIRHEKEINSHNDKLSDLHAKMAVVAIGASTLIAGFFGKFFK